MKKQDLVLVSIETILKFDLMPIFIVKAEERVDAGVEYDATLNARIAKNIFKPRRLNDVIAELEAYIAFCKSNGVVELGLMAFRSRDVDYLIRLLSAYARQGMYDNRFQPLGGTMQAFGVTFSVNILQDDLDVETIVVDIKDWPSSAFPSRRKCFAAVPVELDEQEIRLFDKTVR